MEPSLSLEVKAFLAFVIGWNLIFNFINPLRNSFKDPKTKSFKESIPQAFGSLTIITFLLGAIFFPRQMISPVKIFNLNPPLMVVLTIPYMFGGFYNLYISSKVRGNKAIGPILAFGSFLIFAFVMLMANFR